MTVDHSWATRRTDIGEQQACIEPARNPLTRADNDTACFEAARDPLGRDRGSASSGRILRAVING